MKLSKSIRHYIFAILVFLLTCPIVSAQGPDKKIQTVVNLLDYIARDYAGAVENNKVISETEYAEMIDFCGSVYTLSDEISYQKQQSKNPILSQVKHLQRRITEKADITEIDSLAKKVRSEIITATGFNPLPAQYPSLVAGGMLYKTYCVSCHGEQGNGKGPAAKGLDPEPTNFLDAQGMLPVSPLAAFNTISIGLQGTAMTGFSQALNEKQIWDLAFYIKSLPARQTGIDSVKAEQIRHAMKESLPLDLIASGSDTDLLKILTGSQEDKLLKLAAIRLQNPPSGPNAYIDLAKSNLQQALASYERQEKKEARQLTLTAYLEGIEPIEAQLTATAPQLTIAIEEQMLLLRRLIESNATTDELRQEVAKTSNMIDEAGSVLGDKKFTFWVSFFLTMSILLREGLEAFLIVALLLAIVRKTSTFKAQAWIHGGWLAAVGAGFAGWLISDWILKISGASREVMEGFVSLLAVVILAYVGLWLHSHSNAQKWKEFVEIRLKKLVSSESLWGLSLFVFMVVFREAFESVLFLQAIKLQTVANAQNAIGLGTLASAVVIAIGVTFVLKFSKRLPIPKLFNFSAWIVALLSVVLIGKGIHSLQEAGFISVTGVPINVRLDLLGIYPTLETIGSQLALIVILLIVPIWRSKTRSKNATMNATQV